MAGFGIGLRLTFHVGIGQVIQSYRLLQGKQLRDGAKDMGLNRLALVQQRITGAVQAHVGQSGEVHIQQFTQGAVGLQPIPGGKFGGGLGHAANQVAHNTGTSHGVDAQFGELLHHSSLHSKDCGLSNCSRRLHSSGQSS